MSIKILLFYIYLSKIFVFAKADEHCEKVSFKIISTSKFFESTRIRVSFNLKTNFDEVKILCIQNISFYDIEALTVEAKSQKLIIEDTFYLEKLPKNNSYAQAPLSITFNNFKGLKSSLRNLFKNFKLNNYNSFIVTFYNSYLQTIGPCDLTDGKAGFFHSTNQLDFAYTCKYSKSICPLIFQNSIINKIRLYGLANNFFKKNLVGFKELNIKNINFTLKYLEMFIFHANLNRTLTSESIFKNVKQLTLNGIIDNISPNEFEMLINMYILRLYVENLKYFIYENWKSLSRLNHLKNQKILYIEFKNSHDFQIITFSDQDFCLFEKFPHSNLVYPVFTQRTILENCTCSLLWLLKDTYRLDFNLNPAYTNYLAKNYEPCVEKKYFELTLNKCNFTWRLWLCNKTNFEIVKEYGTLDREYYSFRIVYILIIFFPILSTTGFLTNFLNLKIFSSIKSDLKACRFSIFMHKLIIVNSTLNCVYCLIILLHMMNKCVTRNGIFCSQINRLVTIQYFDKFAVEIIGNLIKTLSNIMTILISLNRYLTLNEKIKSHFRKNPKIIKFLKFFLIILMSIFCLIFIIERSLNVRINTFHANLNDFGQYSEYPDKNLFPDQKYRTILPQIINKLTIALYITLFVLNDLLFLIAMMIIEIFILITARRFYNSKIRLTKKRLFYKCERKVTCVILIYLLVNFVFKLFEFLINAFIAYERLSFGFNSNGCLKTAKFCSNLQEVGELFFLITIIFPTIAYYYLNKNFRCHLKTLVSAFYTIKSNAENSKN
ncbi:unnamed protein product [Brachionus calyciflorus]|uniref:G-protein coupled receptors family 1 profile domain-containing protein n=1 Tax=Brachionus calyciflorus TaxID=104777 RepID=A0A814JT11_9BILA|nr:unnamed protein product [Brachionus calyciflorus]